MSKNHQQDKPRREELLESLTKESSLALILADESGVLSALNNNSICETLNQSGEYSFQCAMFCGKAPELATAEKKTISVRCHAGLHFNIVPLKSGEDKQLVAIVGRTFLKSEDYRKATSRAIDGDWKELPSEKIFQNVLLSSSENEINKISKRLEKLSDEEKALFFEIEKPETEENQRTSEIKNSQAKEISRLIEEFQKKQEQLTVVTEEITAKQSEELEEIAAWRSRFGSLLEMDYQNALVSIADYLTNRYQIKNLVWLENRDNILESIWGGGNFKGQQIQISISAADSRLLEVVKNETSLELRERKPSDKSLNSQPNINLFPLAVGGIIRSALAVGDEFSGKNIRQRIARFIRHVAPEIEILRLREEIKRQSVITKAVKKINQALKRVDYEDFWLVLAQKSAELMRAERGSILVYEEDSETFVVKAAVGNRADIVKMQENKELGERIAHNVLRSGRPLVVRNIQKAGIPPAPADWKYKTDSFISYPIVISGRKIGVLNLTDRIDGESYDERDLDVLHTLAPQIALALDRMQLLRKADEFEQLSITDALTGLVNRRYLEERLAEELSRSQRHGYPMSFMMIDVDSFKSYNDNFGHTTGDKALQLVGQCLKSTLRGADVAARYGGEEFSILLPQTTLKEAVTIAERIRKKVEKTIFPSRQVTISVGIATCSNELQEVLPLVSAADKALYQAKEKGRNNVQIYKKTEEKDLER